MKQHLLPFLVIALLSTLRADTHEFTNTDGRTLEAEIFNADSTRIWLNLKGGRTATVPLNSLIETDQIYVSKWIANRLPDLEVKPDFYKGLSKDRDRRNVTRQNFKMAVAVKNFSPDIDLEESEVTYLLIGRNINNDDQYKVMSRQVHDLTIPHGQTKEIIFEEITNRYSEFDARGNDERAGRGYRGLGYVLRIVRKRDQRPIHLSSPTPLLEKAKNEIALLAEGDEVDDTFIKKEEKIVPKEPKKKEEPPVITIR